MVIYYSSRRKLRHKVWLDFFWDGARLLCTVATPVYTHCGSTRGSSSLYPQDHLAWCTFLISVSQLLKRELELPKSKESGQSGVGMALSPWLLWLVWVVWEQWWRGWGQALRGGLPGVCMGSGDKTSTPPPPWGHRVWGLCGKEPQIEGREHRVVVRGRTGHHSQFRSCWVTLGNFLASLTLVVLLCVTGIIILPAS